MLIKDQSKIECYNFFFHPLSPYHSTKTTILSLITNVALAVFSCGLYLLVFAAVHALEHRKILEIRFIKCDLDHLKEKQKQQLQQLEEWAAEGKWFNIHNAHYDWWMFPLHRPSSYNYEYSVTKEDVQRLKQDNEFMKNYRKGVTVVAKAWGWDIEKKQDLTQGDQAWDGYEIRLWKMLNSLKIFGETELRRRILHFTDEKVRFTWLAWLRERLF